MAMNRPIAAEQNNYIRIIFFMGTCALPENFRDVLEWPQIPFPRTWAEYDRRSHSRDEVIKNAAGKNSEVHPAD